MIYSTRACTLGRIEVFTCCCWDVVPFMNKSMFNRRRHRRLFFHNLCHPLCHGVICRTSAPLFCLTAPVTTPSSLRITGEAYLKACPFCLTAAITTCSPAKQYGAAVIYRWTEFFSFHFFICCTDQSFLLLEESPSRLSLSLDLPLFLRSPSLSPHPLLSFPCS